MNQNVNVLQKVFLFLSIIDRSMSWSSWFSFLFLSFYHLFYVMTESIANLKSDNNQLKT